MLSEHIPVYYLVKIVKVTKNRLILDICVRESKKYRGILCDSKEEDFAFECITRSPRMEFNSFNYFASNFSEKY